MWYMGLLNNYRVMSEFSLFFENNRNISHEVPRVFYFSLRVTSQPESQEQS